MVVKGLIKDCSGQMNVSGRTMGDTYVPAERPEMCRLC